MPLARAFNAMAAQLSQRERELVATNDRLTVIATSDALSGLANRRGFQTRGSAPNGRTRRQAGAPRRPAHDRRRSLQAVQRPLRPRRRRRLPAPDRPSSCRRPPTATTSIAGALWRRGIRACCCPAPTSMPCSRPGERLMRREIEEKDCAFQHAIISHWDR